jgi:hypothetical protein
MNKELLPITAKQQINIIMLDSAIPSAVYVMTGVYIFLVFFFSCLNVTQSPVV